MESLCHHVFGFILRNDLVGLQTALKQFPDTIEYIDQYSNTPLLYACYYGRSQIVSYLLAIGANHQRINIFGQNALTLATYSGDLETCNVILAHCDFNEFNATGILSPLCVAVLQGYTDIAKFFLTLEMPTKNLFDCSSESIHGVCPMQLAQFKDDADMMNLLQLRHQLHVFKTP